LAPFRGERGLGVGGLGRQVERHGVALAELGAHAGAVHHEFRVAELDLVVELEAFQFGGMGEIQGEGGECRQSEFLHAVSFT
jgi:hypothetical protein